PSGPAARRPVAVPQGAGAGVVRVRARLGGRGPRGRRRAGGRRAHRVRRPGAPALAGGGRRGCPSRRGRRHRGVRRGRRRGAGRRPAAARQRLQGEPGPGRARADARGARGVSVAVRNVGAPVERIEGREKVTGRAVYAHEHDPEGVAYAAIVTSSVARGSVRGIDAEAARALPGFLGLLSAENAPSLPGAEGELAVLQSPAVAYRGEIVAVAIAETLETARQAAELVRVDYEAAPHDVVLRLDHPELYRPEKVNPNFPTDTEEGDVDAALAAAAVSVDETYTTPTEHNNAMEPHATIALWEGDGLTLYDSNQGAWNVAQAMAKVFAIAAERVRVIAPHVGGGFGSKGTPRPHVVLAALCARHVGRPVKLAVTRQQMFTLTGYRTP